MTRHKNSITDAQDVTFSPTLFSVTSTITGFGADFAFSTDSEYKKGEMFPSNIRTRCSFNYMDKLLRCSI